MLSSTGHIGCWVCGQIEIVMQPLEPVYFFMYFLPVSTHVVMFRPDGMGHCT